MVRIVGKVKGSCVLLMALAAIPGSVVAGVSEMAKDIGFSHGFRLAAKSADGTPDEIALTFLRDYLAKESIPMDQGLRIRLRVDELASGKIPIPVPAGVADTIKHVKYISGTFSNKACNIDLCDGKGERIEILKTVRPGLFGIVWEKGP